MKRIFSIFMVITVLLLALPIFAADSNLISSEYYKKLAAGDVCGLIEGHHCDMCDDDTDIIDTAEICPDCGIGTLRAVCSGVRKLDGGNDCFYDDCYLQGYPYYHPSDCKTVIIRFYTDITCSYAPCGYRSCGSGSHIEAYFHSSDPSVADNHYCSLIQDHRSSDYGAGTDVNDSFREKDPIAAGDFCTVHQMFGCNCSDEDKYAD